MIIKKMKGNGFGGVLSYVLNDKEDGQDNRAEVIGGNMWGQKVGELSKEFAQLRQLKPQAKNPVRHFAIRLHPKDKALTDDQWNKLGNEFCDKFGYINTYKVFVLHRDSNPPHLHIVTSQIGFEGKLNREYKDIYRIKNFCRTSEQAMGLIAVDNKHTGKSKLYHVRKRGTCKIDHQARQAKMQSLLTTASAQQTQPTIQAPRQKLDPIQKQAQSFITEVFTAAKTNGGRFMELVKSESALLGQINSLKAMLIKAKGTPQEKVLAAQLADVEKQMAENFAQKIQAWNMQAQQEQEHTQQQKRRLKL